MNDWEVWQIVDSAFPTGAFAHSSGLESAWRHGEIDDADALGRFLDASILQAGFAVVPFVTASYCDLARMEALDASCEAFLTNPVANRASRIQGRTLVATAGRIWPSAELADVQRRARRTLMHAAPVSGAIFRALGVPLQTARRVTLFVTARGVISAAVRLGIVGSFEAQRMQHACAPRLEEVAHRCAGVTMDDLAQTAPIVDLFQSAHDRLYSRLFQS